MPICPWEAPTAPAPPQALPCPTPPHSADGEPAHLSDEGAGGAGASESTAITDPPPRASGDTAGWSEEGAGPPQATAVSVPPPREHANPTRLSEVGGPWLTSVSVPGPGDGVTGGARSRRGSPGEEAPNGPDWLPQRTCPAKSAGNRLTWQRGAGEALAWQVSPSC